MDQYGRLGSKNGFNNNTKFINPTAETKNTSYNRSNLGQVNNNLKNNRTNSSRGQLPLKPSINTYEQETQDTLRFIKSKGNLVVPNKEVVTNKLRGVSKGSHNTNININTNISSINQESKRQMKPAFDNKVIPKSNNNYGVSGAKFSTKNSNLSGIDFMVDGTTSIKKQSNYNENRSNVPYQSNSRAMSSSKLISSKQNSNHINKSNLNPNFNGPSNNYSRGNKEFEHRPITTNKSKSRMESGFNNEVLGKCKDCGRNFREEALLKHIKICKKVFQSKRKKFDSKKKRIIDSEHAMLLRQADKAENNPKLKQIRARKKENWKVQSELLRNVAKANRSYSNGNQMVNNRMYNNKSSKGVVNNSSKKGNNINYDYGFSHMGLYSFKIGGMSSLPNDGLTLCDTCGRRYNETAYEKHLPGCQKRDKENLIKHKFSKPSFNSNKMKKY